MKKLLIVCSMLILADVMAFSQDTATAVLKRIEAAAGDIKKDVAAIKGEVVKADPEPFTGQSIFEDREGMSAIFLPWGGTLRLNTGDGSLKLSFSSLVSDKKFFYGAEVVGETADGIMPLIGEGRITPGVKLNAVMGLQELLPKADLLDAWALLKLGYERSDFKLFDSSLAIANQFKDSTFGTFTTSLAFNLKIKGNAVVGVSLGYQKKNNYDDLDEVEVTDTKTWVDPATGIGRTYKSTTKARQGVYAESKVIPLNIDGFWFSKNTPRIGFYHFLHTEFSKSESTTGLGTGLYLLKKKNPLSSIAGIVFEIPDVSKLNNDGFGKTFTINFVVGYNFGFKKK